MFSGIVESQVLVTAAESRQRAIRLVLERPSSFDDIKTGDSIAVNGVCLTVEKFSEEAIEFTIGHETLNITHWDKEDLIGQSVNVERALSVQARLHGHWVTGHVDCLAKIKDSRFEGENFILDLEFPKSYSAFIWKKGSVTLNGVSLTVNEKSENAFSVCLIPETLRVTNLKDVQPGDSVNLEVDYLARAVVNTAEQFLSEGKFNKVSQLDG